MREIKFRGKRLDSGEWVYGDLLRRSGKTYIFLDLESKSFHYLRKLEVDPKTVGQYTELKDKDGKEIYKGDIVTHHVKREDNYYRHQIEKCEIIGNKYDNPELLEVYRAAKETIYAVSYRDNPICHTVIPKFELMEEAIKKLEERHCKSIKDVENNERN
tara:strand:+ start:5032 stop:5508 length:477 start_codon:yes stop_codon:yes gene_type:complete